MINPKSIALALAVLVIAVGVGRLISPSSPPAEDARCTPVLAASLPLQMHEFDATLPVTLDGHETQFALDTGTSDSYVLKEAREKFALPSALAPESWTVGSFAGDRPQTEFVRAAHLVLAGRDYGPRTMPVTIIESDATAKEPRTEMGTIGADLLKDFDVDIDVPSLRITFYKVAASCAVHRPTWAFPSTSVPIMPLPGLSLTIPVAFDGRTTPTLFASYWQRTLIRDFPSGTAGTLPPVAETPPIPLAPLARVDKIAIGGLVDDEPMAVRLWRKPPPVDYETKPDTSNVAILGFDFIRRHRFWMAMASNQLFVALPASGDKTADHSGKPP